MEAVAVAPIAQPRSTRFGAVTATFLFAAGLTAALAPVWLSVWSVFLFAGPHNWMEARYLLARIPVRWGQARLFFLVAAAGVAVLGAGWLLLEARGLFHTALLGWIWLLVRLHDRKLAARWRAPLALLAGAAWLAPIAADYAVVYAHPLVALWFLDRQIRRSHPEWSAAWRWCLTAVPLLASLVAWANRFGGGGTLALSLVQQAGHPAFVAVHAFLELAHYAVWIVALPLLGMAEAPWRWRGIPLVRHRLGWPRLVKALLAAGAAACALLWLGFATDYETTRRLYFTVAIVHVLAEAPFLVRLVGR
jgi:hypothetical protein